jgi:hypothetical protein
MGGWCVGFGFIFLYNSANNYLVDSYQHQAASALAAKTFIRSFWGAAVVLFTVQMYATLGKLAFIRLLVLNNRQNANETQGINGLLRSWPSSRSLAARSRMCSTSTALGSDNCLTTPTLAMRRTTPRGRSNGMCSRKWLQCWRIGAGKEREKETNTHRIGSMPA